MRTQGERRSPRWGEPTIDIIQSFTPELWLTAITFFVIGDILTTAVGLTYGGVAEAGPIVGALIRNYGLVVLVPMKALSLGIAYVLWRFVPAPYAVGVPLGLATLGILATGWNIGVLVVLTRGL